MKKDEVYRKEKLAMILRYEESGLSQKEFCLKEALSYHTFYYWKRIYKRGNTSPSGFVKLKAMPDIEQPKICFAEILFSGGNRIVLYSPMSSIELRQLAR